jgi:methylsterol monooxygenase/4-alpha-methyl-delta7-sterol-4alpha-methyl oxidase
MSKLSTTELSLEDILDYEKVRYKRKGYGLIVAFMIFLLWFFVVPQMAPYFWPYKIANPRLYSAVFAFFVHNSVFYIANFCFWVIYKIEHPFFERYKTHDKPWPWKSDPEKWNQLLKQTIKILFINQLIILPILLFISYIVNKESVVRTSYETLPSSGEIIWQTTFLMVIEDFTFYWTHRFLHWDKIYAYIHKQHHQYVNTVSIASEYAHPLEFILSNALPSNIGVLILGHRMHLFTLGMWLILRIFETTDGHCGYEFSWSPYRLLPMSGSSEYHNFHHLNFKGNYGSFFTIWDTVFKTINKKYQEFTDRKLALMMNYKEEGKKVE